MMADPRPPREYQVLQRPPRDFFTPVARPIAGLLYLAFCVSVLCFIGFGAHNLASRAPAMVQPPATATYARDYRDSPIVDLSGEDLEHLSVPVRLRDRDHLRQHIHQHIVAHGGALVIGFWNDDDPRPTKDRRDTDVPRNNHVYHVNAAYLELVQALDDPPWRDPTHYAQWARAQESTPVALLGPRDTYVRVKTGFLWFENTRVRFLTIIIAASITGGLLLAISLSIGMYWSQERSRIRNR